MKEALLKLFSSSKTWTMILGGLATICATLLARYGLQVSDEAVKMTAEFAAGLVAVLLAAQGATDHGKAAAQISADAGMPSGGTGNATANVTVTPPAVATPTPTPPSSSPGGVAAVLALILLGGSMVGAVSVSAGCATTSARQTSINTTLAALNVGVDAFTAWDTAHQKDIIAKATSEADGAAKLAAYRVQQAKVVAWIGAAYAALGAAQTINDSHTLAAALATLALAQAAWDDLKRTGAVGVSP